VFLCEGLIMTEAVTKLVVDGNAAFQVLEKVKTGFQSVGQASDKATAAIADFDAHMVKYNQQIAAGERLTTITAEKITREQRKFDALIAKSGPLAALEIRQANELREANIAARNAVIVGLASEQEARARLLDLVRSQQSAYDQLAAKVNSTGAAAATNVQRINDTTAAYDRLHRAANDNAISSANLAAQFQDIAVTAAMGMSPLQIALQQGTQIAGAFGNAGASSAVRALGSAFLSLLNPVSLMAIGLTAAAAAAIQFFSGIGDDAEDAVKSASKLAVSYDGVRGMIKDLEGVQDSYREAMVASASTHSQVSASIIADTKAEFDAKKSLLELQLEYQRGLLKTKQAELNAKADALREEIQSKVRTRYDLESRGYADPNIGRFTQLPDDITGLARTREILENSPIALELKKLRAEFGLNELAAANLEKALATTFQSVDGGAGSIYSLGKAAQDSASSVVGFAQALGTLSDMVPALSSVERGLSGVKSANEAYAAALGALNRDMQTGVIKSEDVYFDRLRKVEAAHKDALAAVTGYADAVDMVSKVERQNALEAMSDREAAAARIRDTYADQEKAIRATIAAGADQAKVEALIARNSDAMNAALQNSARHFDEVADKAGEKGAAKSVRDYERALSSAQNTADRLVDKMFPAEGARREAQELLGLLDQYGDKLTDVQRVALATEADNLFRAADLGLRDLDQATRKRGKSMADSLESTLGSALSDLFSSPMKDADDFFDRILSGFARLGEANLEKAFDGIFGTGTPSSSIGGVGASRNLLSGLSGLFGVSSASQLRDVSSALGKTSKSAMDVARQFEGLNERADSPVLDSFMMASGTWNKLSAQDTAWCAAFANASIVKAGGQGTGSNLASSFLDWGMGTNNPKPGDIVVLRPQAAGSSGHVGFLASMGNGKVQIFGGNQDNGVNLKSFDIGEVASFRTDPSLLRTAVSDGVIDANKQLYSSANSRNAISQSGGFQANTTFGDFLGAGGQSPFGGSSGGAMGGLGGLNGLLGAGLGGFGLGFQNQNAAMGGIGGALSGMAAGPIGMLVGGIGGILGGIFGKSRQKKQELRQAQQELESQIGAITELMRTATGDFMGAFEKQYSQTTDEFTKAIKLAEKAKDYALKADLEGAMNEFFVELTDRWNRGFEGMIASLESGQGLDGAFLQGMDSVEKMRESLVGFVNDAKMFEEADGDLAGYYRDSRTTAKPELFGYRAEYRERQTHDADWIYNVLPEGYQNVADQMLNLGVAAYTEAGGALYGSLSELINVARAAGLEVDQLGMVTRKAAEANETLVNSAERARQAAIKSALASLSGADEFTDVEEAMQKLQGTAAGLPSLLSDLGMSSEEAAKAIEDSFAVALQKLQDDVLKDLRQSIRDLSGLGSLNEIIGAQEIYQDRLKDLAAVSLDSGIALAELRVRLQQISGDFTLTGDRADDLLARTALGLLGGAREFSEVEKSMHTLRVTADALPQVLADVGISAEDAANAIADGFNMAFRDLQKGVIDDLRQSIRDLSGAGYLNEIIGAQDIFETRVKDLTAVGLGGALAVDELRARLQQMSGGFVTTADVTRQAANDNMSLADAVELSRQAIIQTALAMVGGTVELSDVEQAMQDLRATTGSLPALFIDLGIAAEDAANAASAAFVDAYDDIRRGLITDIRQSINDASGFGYLNDFMDAQETYKDRLKDLASAGLGSQIAVEELHASLRQISGDLDLTDDQFRRLSEVFPEIGGAVLQLIGLGASDPSSALAKAKADVEDAKSDLQSAYDDEKSRLEQLISKHQAYTKSLQTFIDSLKLDQNLSPLDPFQRLQEAQRQFQDTAGLALTGDEDALGRLEDVSRAYLDEAKAYYASSESYFSIFGDVQKILDQALDVSGDQLSEAEKQLEALTDLVNPLLDINDGVMSVADAISAFELAQSQVAQAEAAQTAYQNSLFEQMLLLMRWQSGGSASTEYDRAIGYLNRNPDVQAAIAAGQTFGTLSNDLAVLARAHWEQFGQYEVRPGGFANGGFHGGGLRLVGERGPEIEATGPSRIWTFEQTRSMLSGGDSSALVAELQALRSQVAALQDEMARNTMTTAAGAQAQVAAVGETTRAVSQQTDSARRERFRRTG
jgi:uncharacterized protein (TIGR02594 family)